MSNEPGATFARIVTRWDVDSAAVSSQPE